MTLTENRSERGIPNALMGALLVWVAVLVYASANSIISLLADIGRQNPVMGRNAVTLCNLLFLGSLLSLIPMIAVFHKDWTRDKLRHLTRRNWAILTVSGILSSAVTPALFFIALDYTTVTNVVLIGRIEPPLFLLTAWLVLRERLDPWALAAGLIALCGALVMLALNRDGGAFTFGKGEIATIFATLSFIASTIISRASLKGIPLGIFSVYRMALGTVVYYFLALYLYGALHFQDIFSAIVWKWVWVYVIIVILIGQFAWTLGLKHARSGDISLATSFSPLAALMIAMILVGEDPGPGLIPGGAIILVAIGIGQYGRSRQKKTERRLAETRRMETDDALEYEGRVNFKGV
ncbi:Permease of the drug/metabolite transporter (DMT) superfamily [Roseovarius azorensis]|uniref:Permease of the drug/metabolite transporter (DMT) superfamily n=1 Tax=Roseovarius azorensis TaxID=1287727 RepID=A0A1H7XL95_9RHOB|nr:DMT family transporter [Roseovarius azorensis]SEM33947.1 Permease of the drug/metabolite transporter (DMT) superfamily [Roseovarius azorensis]